MPIVKDHESQLAQDSQCGPTGTAATSKIHTARCIALFPGAFRPPHIDHFATVQDLASRPDIDEVVVIISNRCRNIPGTSKVLDVDVAQRIWSIYLQGFSKVRIETAPKGATKHARDYIERAAARDTLLFCVGEKDYHQGDGRFKKIGALAERRGVRVKVVPGNPRSVPVRATQLREMLARGNASQDEFFAALPGHLSAAQRTEVWTVCRDGMQDIRATVMQKVRTLVAQNVGEFDDIGVAKSGKPDEVFRLRLKDGRLIFVKYAHDTVKAACIGTPHSLKPRKRLKVERNAVKWLRANITTDIAIPEVVCFDKETKTLMLSEVCPGGRPLRDDLTQGIFDPIIAGKASRFLAQCHTSVERREPLWDDDKTDLKHWRSMLTLRTVDIKTDKITAQTCQDLKDLARASDDARVNRFVNLDYSPKNILVNKGLIGVIDFELSSTIGDPACDFGFFLGHYLFWGFYTSSNLSCQQAIREALGAYQHEVGNLWPSMQSRVAAFAGATILHAVTSVDRINVQGNEGLLLAEGAHLLSMGMHSGEDSTQILCDAVG